MNLDEEGKPNRWRVENSWGDAPGKKGYYVMSDEWFDEYMYQIVVNKKYLPDSYIAEYDSEPIMLEPWDPTNKSLISGLRTILRNSLTGSFCFYHPTFCMASLAQDIQSYLVQARGTTQAQSLLIQDHTHPLVHAHHILK